MPSVCFTIGIGVLMLFFYCPFGLLFSCIIGVLLATLPGGIDRSSVGFGDRDSWCLLIGILAITTYLQALQTLVSPSIENNYGYRRRYLLAHGKLRLWSLSKT